MSDSDPREGLSPRLVSLTRGIPIRSASILALVVLSLSVPLATADGQWTCDGVAVPVGENGCVGEWSYSSGHDCADGGYTYSGTGAYVQGQPIGWVYACSGPSSGEGWFVGLPVWVRQGEGATTSCTLGPLECPLGLLPPPAPALP